MRSASKSIGSLRQRRGIRSRARFPSLESDVLFVQLVVREPKPGSTESISQYRQPGRWNQLLVNSAGRLLRTKGCYHLVRHASRVPEKVTWIDRFARTYLEPSDGSVLDLDSPEFLNSLGSARTIFLKGWLIRANESVAKHADLLREHFKPQPSFRQSADQRLTRLREQCDVVVGVHVRQGDYRTWLQGKFFFENARYAQWMHEIAEQLPGQRVGFLVCGDEPHTESEFSELTTCCSGGELAADLYALSRCDYLFGPLSTFSQWASFSGNVPLRFLRSNADPLNLQHFQVADLDFLPFQ